MYSSDAEVAPVRISVNINGARPLVAPRTGAGVTKSASVDVITPMRSMARLIGTSKAEAVLAADKDLPTLYVLTRSESDP
jgi:hypothetical protein